MKKYVFGTGAIIWGIFFFGFLMGFVFNLKDLKFPNAIPAIIAMVICGLGTVINGILWFKAMKTDKQTSAKTTEPVVCSLCGQSPTAKTLMDGKICRNCIIECGSLIPSINWNKTSAKWATDCIKFKAENESRKATYSKTKVIKKYFEADEQNRLWKAPSTFPQIIFRYDEVINFDLLENGNSYIEGGLGSAVIGGALFGAAGAIVGSNVGKKTQKEAITEFRIKIVTSNPVIPEVYIDLIPLVMGSKPSVIRNDFNYKSYSESAQQILSYLTIMCNKNTTAESSNVSVTAAPSSADEILKFKQLLDQGVITQEEFDKKKQQLLNQ